jgi:UDP-3-O-[3-hydroxymyristoyl] N-acetylglucosamine deacetylase
MSAARQTTLARPVTLAGFGVHSAAPASLVIRPAAANHGVVFLRRGLEDGISRRIPARYGLVSMTELCTVVGEPSHGAVSTIEHLMAALFGLGIDNALVDIDGPEVPVMDGSAESFVGVLLQAERVTLPAARRFVRVLRPVVVEDDRARCELAPNEDGLRLDVAIEFDSPVIGHQRCQLDLTPDSFVRELARARTFGFMRDVEKLWKAGFALGASLENTVAIGDDSIINPEGLRFRDEFVRHKTLDAVGDLALAGLNLHASFTSYCAGHRHNVAVLRALFSDKANFEIVEASDARDQRRVPMSAAALAPSLT